MYAGYNVPTFARLASWEPMTQGRWYSARFGWSWSKMKVPAVLEEGVADDMHTAAHGWQGLRSWDFWCASVAGEYVAGAYRASAPSLRIRWTPQVRVQDVEAMTERWAALGGQVVLKPCQIMQIGIMAVVASQAGTDEAVLVEPLACDSAKSRGRGKVAGIELRYREPDDLGRWCELFEWRRRDGEGDPSLYRGGDAVGWARPVGEGLQRWVTCWGGQGTTVAEAVEDGARVVATHGHRTTLIDPWGVELGIA